MSIRRSSARAVAGALLVLAAGSAVAQASGPAFADLKGRGDARPAGVAPRPTPPASAPSVRLRPLDETGDAAAPAGNLQQERAVVVPQVSLPLGRTPPPPARGESARLDARRPALRGGIDDAAARCSGQSDARVRAQCLDRVPVGTTPIGVPR